MANFNVSLDIEADGEISAQKTGTFDTAIKLTTDVDNTDTFNLLVTGEAAKGGGSLDNAKALMIKNSGIVGAEIRISGESWSHNSPDTNGLCFSQI